MSFGAKQFQSWCVLAVAGCAGGVSAQAAVIDNFESGTLSNWTAQCGGWEIVAPGHNSSFGVKTLSCCCGPGADGFLRHNSFSGSFGRYSYDVFYPSTSGSHDGGFFIGGSNSNQFLWFYISRFPGDNGVDSINRIRNGVIEHLACEPISVGSGTWHTIVIERYPSGVIRVLNDGALFLEGFDATPSQPGGIGLIAHDCGVLYDNITFDPTLPPDPGSVAPCDCPCCPPGGSVACLGGVTTCGDGTCCVGENRCNCPSDCGATFCGDGCCGGGENAGNCPADCGGGAVCGNFVCEGGENCCNCANDCPGNCPECIPTMSEWGLLVLGLLTLTAGTVVVMRRRAVGAG